MNNEAAVPAPPAAKRKKGKLSWVIPVLEVLIVVIYFFLAWKAIESFTSSFSLSALFSDVTNAICFLIVATIVTTIMCFIPVFKSKGNTWIAIWNIVWLGFNLYGWLCD